jgi:arylsulfatase A-like enzyme
MTGKSVYSQNIFMDSILTFITKNKDHPFFLYFPTQLPHGPVSIPAVHPDFANDERLTQIEKEYASMVKILDDNVGQIMSKLKSLHIDDHTIVIFTSDNGHEIYYSQKGRIHKPYTDMKTGVVFDNFQNKYYSEPGGDIFDGNGGRAGLKRSNLQGGVQVPLIIRWPEKIRSQRVSDLLIANYDILPTLAEITGFSGSLNADGVSFYYELTEKDAGPRHEFVVFSSFLGPTLISNDGWKIRAFLANDAFELYYLPDDFREETDLSGKHPEKLKELKGILLEACNGDFINGLYSSANKQINVE